MTFTGRVPPAASFTKLPKVLIALTLKKPPGQSPALPVSTFNS